MAKQIIPNTGRDLIVSFNYDPTGKAWVDCFDNAPLGWAVDDTTLSGAEPIVVGSLPPAAADTAPIELSQWAQYTGGYLVVPDKVRMTPAEFFTWLGTKNGAQREVRGHMKSADMNQAFHQWGGGAPAGGAAGTEAAPPPVEGAYAPGRGPMMDRGPAPDRGQEQRPAHVDGELTSTKHATARARTSSIVMSTGTRMRGSILSAGRARRLTLCDPLTWGRKAPRTRSTTGKAVRLGNLPRPSRLCILRSRNRLRTRPTTDADFQKRRPRISSSQPAMKETAASWAKNQAS